MRQSGQRQTWTAGDYRHVGVQFLLAAEMLCEAVEIRAGEKVLDVATGTGNLALGAARRAAEVTALDLVPELIAVARDRAAAEGLEVAFREGDAEALPFEDASFDVVASTFGVMFAADQERAAAELVRVLRPGGRIGLACWTPSGYMGRMLELNTRYLPPPPGYRPPSRWGTSSGLEELFGGEADIRVTGRTLRWRFSSPEAHARVWAEVYGPTRMTAQALDDEGRAALVADLARMVTELNQDGSTLLLPMDYLEIVIRPR
ncbi:SAM-dependent methyltransferase [Thermocatellispora tengchongensis]|uniref:SAM-dependent methyltransferase n=1 Tax=Thermocatellispora tengchongensis TaxID=1073253 RepID=A0A840P4U1_9ACTN|nr:class I SAM-dependent methyltransferase [Thermocatellispora tengchongensis]MBB5134372.1 SAM-dependent methyltransferase [Thermocatellispora tengchongensis]